MAKQDKKIQTGFDTSTGNTGGRLFNNKGTPNVKHVGASFTDRFSVFHFLINLSNTKFIALLFSVYLMINLFFAMIYFSLGVQNLGITDGNKCNMTAFSNCFFFSAQTLTTVGYGRISPTAFSTSAVSSIESLLGLLLFALITGLSYARFAKPKGKIMFSHHMLIAPYEGKTALMLRIVNPTKHLLSEVEVNITLALHSENEDYAKFEYHTLVLETNKVVSFPLNWTLVHEINEQSPLWNLTKQDFINRKMEALVFIKAYDEHFSSHIQQRKSYIANEVLMNKKFDMMYARNKEDTVTILRVNKLNDVVDA
jgi:inward rectifier potassium channel